MCCPICHDILNFSKSSFYSHPTSIQFYPKPLKKHTNRSHNDYCQPTCMLCSTISSRDIKTNWILRRATKWVNHKIQFKAFLETQLFFLLHKVTVIDKSDPDWWKGKCLGRIGYFPSKYCAKLAAGEKPLQVTHNLQVSDGERGEMTLLRDQIVIQVKIFHLKQSQRRRKL